MNQILHIFQKDTRRFWPEILASLLITALFVVHYPSEWTAYSDQSRQQMLRQITSALSILMPVSWGLIIARVTYAESLVGDNEFWLTRPYEWKKLLSAKVFFLAIWVGLTYLLAQACLLVAAGFHPASYIPSLFSDLFFISAVLLLPLFAIAVVNASFARMTLTLLAALFLFTTFMFFASTIRVDNNYASNPYENVVAIPLVFCVCVAAIILQYATRRVWISRGLLIAIPILVLAAVFAYSRQSLVDSAYPRPSSASTPPVTMSLAGDADHPTQATTSRGQDYITLRVQYTGVPDGYAVFSDNVKATLIAAAGQQWTSPWLRNDDHILPGTHDAYLRLMLPPAVYDRFKSAPVTLHITSALTRLQAGTVTTLNYPSSDVSVPGVGFCSPRFQPGTTLACRSVGWNQKITHITVLWSNTPCSDASPAPENTAQGTAWNGLLPNQFDTGISPVLTQNIWFTNSKARDGYAGFDRGWHLCPGSPLIFTQYNVVDRTQSDITIPNFQIPAIKTN
jgi:hypothetical protein